MRAYVSKDSPKAARDVALVIVPAVETLLSRSPKLGRPGRVTGTRELVVSGTPYIVPYRVRDNEVQILRVYHAARRWPDRL